MIEDSLITRDNKRISSFLKSLDQMLDDIENLTKNYRPVLGGERYLTDKEVANILKISRRSLQNYRNERRIPYCMLGGKILYRESDIQRLLDEGLKNVYK
ncbi:MAG: helix-turn-helix domain-containing protein [Tannerellaceae bacterium]|nr:helix-turn-helix domain-containing protein [Tannerellaceae bacterium]